MQFSMKLVSNLSTDDLLYACDVFTHQLQNTHLDERVRGMRQLRVYTDAYFRRTGQRYRYEPARERKEKGRRRELII